MQVLRGVRVFSQEGFELEAKSRALEERRIGLNSMCTSCKYGHVYRRRGQLEPAVMCGIAQMPVPSDIVECSRYANIKELTLHEMAGLALNVDGRVGVRDGSYR